MCCASQSGEVKGIGDGSLSGDCATSFSFVGLHSPPARETSPKMSEKTSRDLVVKPGEYAHVLNETHGTITFVVGAYKISLEEAQKTVRLQNASKCQPGGSPRWEICSIEECVTPFVTVKEGWYAVVYNPAEGGKRPSTAEKLDKHPDLQMGQRIIQPGPDSFALWPGQHVEVHKGHAIRHHEYVICRVYNPDEAERNRGVAGVVGSEGLASSEPPDPSEEADSPEEVTPDIFPDKFSMGQEFVVPGTTASFFVPPTGVEVLADPADRSHFIREAVTLEQIEYCMLVGQDGQVRYEVGPQVVFPTAKEVFRTAEVAGKTVRKFRAIELDENAGLHLKVIADHEFGGIQYEQGVELFVTGIDNRLYFPRPEVVLVRQGESEKIYATAVGEGDGRYVLDKTTGSVGLVEGPLMLLPDPRTQVLVRRVLSDLECRLWFPGNVAAINHNRRLRGEPDEAVPVVRRRRVEGAVMAASAAMPDRTDQYGATSKLMYTPAADDGQWADQEAGDQHAGQGIERKTTYTPPRMVNLDASRFDGAVLIDVRSGYAVCVQSRSSERRIVVGPKATLLKYHETLVPFRVTSGRPKNEGGASTESCVYLQVRANRISDEIAVETRDFVKMRVHLSYRVNFDPKHQERWFDVENYVRLLCEDMASRIRLAFKEVTLSKIQESGYGRLRDTVLGEEQEGNRPGYMFEENGAQIYNVEISGIEVEEPRIQQQIASSQANVVALEIQRSFREQEVAAARKVGLLDQEMATTRAATTAHILGKATETAAAEVEKEKKAEEKNRELELAKQETNLKVATAEAIAAGKRREKRQAEHELDHTIVGAAQALRIVQLQEATAARVKEIQAMSPELAAELVNLGTSLRGTAVLKELGSVALLTGGSVTDILARLSLKNGDPSKGLLGALIPTSHAVTVSKASDETPDLRD